MTDNEGNSKELMWVLTDQQVNMFLLAWQLAETFHELYHEALDENEKLKELIVLYERRVRELGGNV